MNDRMEAASRIDRNRRPALFQRITRTRPPVLEQPEPRPERPATSRDIYAAFAEFVQFRPAEIRHRENRVHPGSMAVWDYLDGKGFSIEDVHNLRMGLYTTPEDIRGYLRSAGFSEAAIEESGLVTDHRHAFRHDWRGCLIFPLQNELGQTVDVLAILPPAISGQRLRCEFGRGTAATNMIAYGLPAALATPNSRKNLVLVEDITEALYLQCRGFNNVAAVGGDGREFSSKRWEELARLGFEAVTLAFGNDATRQRDVREALDHALRARTAPEVFVLERTQLLENETLADVARRHGLEACRKAASAKSLAFHAKDFGWSWPRESAPKNGHAIAPSFQRDSYRAYLHAESDKIAHIVERTAIKATIAEVEDALYHRLFGKARAILEARLGSSWWPATIEPPRTQDVANVLDRLCDESARGMIPDHLSRYDGHELQAGTLTILANESPRGRLADLCSRLVTALESRADQTWIVFLREFSEEVVVLGLIAHMTRRMTSAQGLTFEEIQARLSGRDPMDGYGDKPWLVDEAVDRLRRWTDRLKFVSELSQASQAPYWIERIADQQTLGGIFFDSLPQNWQVEKAWTSNGSVGEYSVTACLRELASRLSCAVVALTANAIEQANVLPAGAHAAPWNTPEIHRTVREFRDLIAYWIEHEERLDLRVA